MPTILPKHVAIMLDGNRRWAKKRKLPSFRGHYQGAKTLESLIENAEKLEIPFLTFWGGSAGNLSKRPAREVKTLFDVYGTYFKKLLRRKEIFEEKIRVRIIGRWENMVPQNVKKIFREAIEKTKNHKKYNLTFLIAYDGKEEMLSAITKISARGGSAVGRKNQKSKAKITEAELKQNLWTGELPPVDLMVRTGVENDPHWSAGFMMWHCADTQFYFSKTLWPDFTVKEFKKALKNYAKTQRRFGG